MNPILKQLALKGMTLPLFIRDFMHIPSPTDLGGENHRIVHVFFPINIAILGHNQNLVFSTMFRASLCVLPHRRTMPKTGRSFDRAHPSQRQAWTELNGEVMKADFALGTMKLVWVNHHRWGLPLPEDVCVHSISTISIIYNIRIYIYTCVYIYIHMCIHIYILYIYNIIWHIHIIQLLYAYLWMIKNGMRTFRS